MQMYSICFSWVRIVEVYFLLKEKMEILKWKSIHSVAIEVGKCENTISQFKSRSSASVRDVFLVFLTVPFSCLAVYSRSFSLYSLSLMSTNVACCNRTLVWEKATKNGASHCLPV